MTGVILQVSLKKSWDTLRKSLTGAWPGLLEALAVIGLILVLVAVGTWLWQKRRGGGGQSQGLLWTLLIGAVLAAPTTLIPLLLTIVDFVINTVIRLSKALL